MSKLVFLILGVFALNYISGQPISIKDCPATYTTPSTCNTGSSSTDRCIWNRLIDNCDNYPCEGRTDCKCNTTGCLWNSLTNQCSEKSCTSRVQAECINQCLWVATSCTLQDCTAMTTKRLCGMYSPDCIWNSATTTCSKLCRTYTTSGTCGAIAGCEWVSSACQDKIPCSARNKDACSRVCWYDSIGVGTCRARKCSDYDYIDRPTCEYGGMCMWDGFKCNERACSDRTQNQCVLGCKWVTVNSVSSCVNKACADATYTDDCTVTALQNQSTCTWSNGACS